MPHLIDWSLMLIDGYASDYEMLEDLYNHKKMSLAQIGHLLGVNKYTVRNRLRKINIPIKPRGGDQRSPERILRARSNSKRLKG